VSEFPGPVVLPPDRPRWPSASYERGEGLLVSLPSLSPRAIYVSVHIPRRGRKGHIGWGRQFLPGDQPWWAHYIWWGHL
jgi:hypothetical protein